MGFVFKKPTVTKDPPILKHVLSLNYVMMALCVGFRTHSNNPG